MIRLNLGCGAFPLKDFVNVDILEKYGDVHCDVTNIPYEDNSVGEIYAGHIVEHLTFRDSLRAIEEWHRVLKPKGKLTITFPDYFKILKLYLDGTSGTSALSDRLFGEWTSPDISEHHKQPVITPNLIRNLKKIGFRDVQEIDDSAYLTAKVDWQSIVECVK